MAVKKLRSAERILAIQTAFLGDIVLSSAFLAGLRLCFPRAEIRFLTTPVGTKLLETNPWNVTPVVYDKRGRDSGVRGFFRKRRELRAFRPDLAFCLHRSLRSSLLARAAGGEVWGFAEAAGAFLYDHKVSRRDHMFEADKNNALLATYARAAGVELPRFPKLFVSDRDREEAEKLLGGVGKFLAVAPSSVWATKRWPPERFAELALKALQKHGLRTVIVGGSDPADIEAGAAVRRAFVVARSEESAPLDLSGKTSLGALKSVLSQARIVVANDSAPLHVAIAVGAPVVGVFGPTTRELGFFPLAPEGKAAAAEVAGLYCRPCGLHGHHKCPEGHFRCMLELQSDRVMEEVDRILCR